MLFSTDLKNKDNIDVYVDEVIIKVGENILKIYTPKNIDIVSKERFSEEVWYNMLKPLILNKNGVYRFTSFVNPNSILFYVTEDCISLLNSSEELRVYILSKFNKDMLLFCVFDKQLEENKFYIDGGDSKWQAF